MKASIITTCKGRLQHIKQTLPLMIAQDYDSFEVIVVDYGDPDGCAKALTKAHSSVKFIRVLDNTATFSPSRARNIGAIEATGELLAFVDGDILLEDTWLSVCANKMADGANLVLPEGHSSEVTGTCVIDKRLYRTIRGYGEDLLDWGYQDYDLYNRARESGAVVAAYPQEQVTAIANSDEERVGNYADHRTTYTGTRNKKISKRRIGCVNPDGYGLGKTEVVVNGKSHEKLIVKHTQAVQ